MVEKGDVQSVTDRWESVCILLIGRVWHAGRGGRAFCARQSVFCVYPLSCACRSINI